MLKKKRTVIRTVRFIYIKFTYYYGRTHNDGRNNVAVINALRNFFYCVLFDRVDKTLL